MSDSVGFGMRSACSQCSCWSGRIETRNGQDCVFCEECGKFQYNAPKTETGREVRRLRTRPDIKPSQRARVLDRDNGQCIICHSTNRALDVGHLVSVDEGRALGMNDGDLFSDDNLAAMCAPCNSGYGSISVSPRIVAALIRAARQRGVV